MVLVMEGASINMTNIGSSQKHTTCSIKQFCVKVYNLHIHSLTLSDIQVQYTQNSDIIENCE